jgi:lipopolysaccharide/colanic/teichoic acid biosynthesis glycosyltransferase
VKRVLTRINRVLRPGDGGSFLRVHSAREFASILNRERDRTDRTGQEFSMVVFETGAGSRRSAAVRNLVAVLAQRIHSTDDLGWLEDGRIAATLPHTPPDGAWKLVENVRRALGGNAPAPDCTVYAYPSLWITRTGGKSSEARPADDATPSQTGIPFPKMEYSKAEAGDPARPLEELGSQILSPLPAWKRVIDIVGSLVAMILLSPLALLVALLIKIVSPGPIFFRQERVGYIGRRFTLWKFRTMHVNASTTVHRKHLHELITSGKEMTKLDNDKDDRIIPCGHLLRATGIDELPQLVNVLLGEMSLIGPRPCLAYEAREYLPWQMRRFDAVPGLTGLWQVSGKNRTTFSEMMALDIRYAKKRAFPLDVMILLKTLPAIARQIADRPSFAALRTKGFSIAHRIGATIIALSMVGGAYRK